MTSELEARKMLQSRQIERDITDSRSCLQVAVDLGLTALQPEIDEVAIILDIVEV
jgi:hypothetical protein